MRVLDFITKAAQAGAGLLRGAQNKPDESGCVDLGQFFSGGDGSSLEQAVVVDLKGTRGGSLVGIGLEYAWIDHFYPGATVISQRVETTSGHAYDVITIQTETGEKKELFFEISSFFGKT